MTPYPVPLCAGGCGTPVPATRVLCPPCDALVHMVDPMPFAAPTQLVQLTLAGARPWWAET